MKVQIVMRNVQSEVETSVDLTLNGLKKAFTDVAETGKSLTLSNKDGRAVFIPADAMGYIGTSTGEARRVGFGFTSQQTPASQIDGSGSAKLPAANDEQPEQEDNRRSRTTGVKTTSKRQDDGRLA